MTIQLSKDDCDAALAYARWRHMANFTKQLNEGAKQFGLPPHQIPVCFNERGKRAYESIRTELQREREHSGGAVLLGDGEHWAAVREISRQKHGDQK